jgi:hypothetical protein
LLAIEKLHPETGNETDSIARLLEAQTMTLGDQKVPQTRVFPPDERQMQSS